MPMSRCASRKAPRRAGATVHVPHSAAIATNRAGHASWPPPSIGATRATLPLILPPSHSAPFIATSTPGDGWDDCPGAAVRPVHPHGPQTGVAWLSGAEPSSPGGRGVREALDRRPPVLG